MESSVLRVEQIAKLRERIGVEYPATPWNTIASEDVIMHFAEGIGDDNPLWRDEAYAKKAGFAKILAPPTFLYSIFSGGFGAAGGGLPGAFGLWARDAWEWSRWVLAGEAITATTHLADVIERESRYAGKMVEQVVETVLKDTNGEIMAKNRRSTMKVDRSKAREKDKYTSEVTAYHYSDEEVRAIEAAYEREEGQRRGPVPRYWEDVKVGDKISELVKGPLTVTSMVTYLMGWGSPLCKTDRIAHNYMRKHPGARIVNPLTNVPDLPEASHWDEALAKRSGLPGGYDIGTQRVSWFAHLMTDWMGNAGFLKSLDLKLIRPNYVGDTTWCRGAVTKKYLDGQEHLLDCELWGDSQRSERTTIAQATVRLPSKMVTNL